MRRSIALVTCTTSGLGYAASSMLAAAGYRQVIVTGRSLARVEETATQLEAETKAQGFTPPELDLNESSSVQSALASLRMPVCRVVSHHSVRNQHDGSGRRSSERSTSGPQRRLPEDGTWLQRSELVATRWAPCRQETT